MAKFISRMAKNVMLFLIKLYQLIASPLLPKNCRHIPSCSEYAKEAITYHGPLKGFWLSAQRLCRCHPWGSYGYDPVDHQK